MRVDLTTEFQGFRPSACGEEGGEGGRIYGNATVVEVIEDDESLTEFVLRREFFDLTVDDVWILTVEWEG